MITFECYNNVRAVHLPPRETCDFMTKKCKAHCGYRVNRFEEDVFEELKIESASNIKLKIRDELREYKCKMLSWFATGDCPEDMTDKITTIIDWLAEEGFIQCGFTRNKRLWENLLPLNNVTLGLTVEDHNKAKRMSDRGLISVPDYDSWTVTLYKEGSSIYNCGGGFGTTCGEGFVITKASEVYPEDCGQCYDNSRGCFN